MDFKLCSSAFADGEYLPAWYCSDCQNASPPFGWDGEPEGTVSLAMVCISSSGKVHWVMWNIPNTTKTVYGMQPAQENLPEGIVQGVNDFGDTGWTGPAEEKRSISLTLHLYALDSKLGLAGSGANRQSLEEAMEGHILKKASLTCACS